MAFPATWLSGVRTGSCPLGRTAKRTQVFVGCFAHVVWVTVKAA